MRARPWLIALLLATALPAGAAEKAEDPAAYERVTLERGAKVAAALALGDAAKTERVAALVARQYRDLRAIHDANPTGVPRANKPGDPEVKRKLDALHAEFLARLETELTPTQVDQVKDGMTYGVLPLTFRVYQEMLPNMTAEQRNQIHAWLVEARELAMDAGTSEEKHAWFGKYKGRINNYLAKAGIDMKQAERDLAARQKAGQESAPRTKIR
jgi:hypothetical protein